MPFLTPVIVAVGEAFTAVGGALTGIGGGAAVGGAAGGAVGGAVGGAATGIFAGGGAGALLGGVLSGLGSSMLKKESMEKEYSLMGQLRAEDDARQEARYEGVGDATAFWDSDFTEGSGIGGMGMAGKTKPQTGAGAGAKVGKRALPGEQYRVDPKKAMTSPKFKYNKQTRQIEREGA